MLDSIMVIACIALGSNLGEREATLRQALEQINALSETRIIAVSQFHQTLPVDAPPNSPQFLNAAATVETSLSAEHFMQALLDIEERLGRHRQAGLINAPRPIDLDLLLYGNQILESPVLTLPHPRMHQRRFVLAPLAEIAPDIIHPKLNQTIRELLASLPPENSQSRKEGPRVKSFQTIADYRAWRKTIPADALVAFVPTMGALHEGHASLVRHARQLAGKSGTVVASIFVNPTQFGPNEDYNKYPRTLDADLQILAAANCDAVFVPSAKEMYPDLGVTSAAITGVSVDPGHLADTLEGAIRPGHFRGVCTVVAKLLNITQPTHMIMGQKDFQQQAVLRQMCRDLDMPVEVITAPTIREPDGLAMSSRNRYLSAEERPRAVGLYEALSWARTQFLAGERQVATLEAGMKQRLEARDLIVQYAVIADTATLQPYIPTSPRPPVALIAVKLGATRLIDNMILE